MKSTLNRLQFQHPLNEINILQIYNFNIHLMKSTLNRLQFQHSLNEINILHLLNEINRLQFQHLPNEMIEIIILQIYNFSIHLMKSTD
jgi:hypothetical protein